MVSEKYSNKFLKVKILFLTRKFFPITGGVERHIYEISKKLVEKGNKITVVQEKNFENFVNFFSNSGIKAFVIPVTKREKLKKFEIWGWLCKNISLIKEADIVHCHDVFFWMLPFRFLYPFKKIYTTFHGWEGIYPPARRAIWVRKLSESLSNGNICVGKYIPKWYGTRADFITYGGVKKKKTTIKKGSGLLFVGRLEQDTGLPIYFKALRFLKKEKFEIKFIGDGSLREQAGKLGRVLGFVDNVQSHISSSRFVFTSGYLSILEAMINKRLVFAVYDNPLKEDYLKLSPFSEYIIIEKEPEALIKKVKYFLSHPDEEEKLVNNAYLFAQKQTWDSVVRIYENLWKGSEVKMNKEEDNK